MQRGMGHICENPYSVLRSSCLFIAFIFFIVLFSKQSFAETTNTYLQWECATGDDGKWICCCARFSGHVRSRRRVVLCLRIDRRRRFVASENFHDRDRSQDCERRSREKCIRLIKLLEDVVRARRTPSTFCYSSSRYILSTLSTHTRRPRRRHVRRRVTWS